MVKSNKGFAELIINCEADVAFGIIQTSRSEEHPEGDAHLAWTRLINKYEPTTKSNMMKMKK